ncbi:MAG: MBL fold metallo-hydrolase [Armatimonadetes bacterium]|nr:MBL fold metallo-hydrolase [Armatimonadota bacterium]
MRLTILGSGTVQPSPDRACSGYLVETGSQRLVFDLGARAMHRLLTATAEPWNVERLFFSHLHPDHTSDLVPFLFALNYAPGWIRSRPLRVHAPAGFGEFFPKLVAAFPFVEPKRYEMQLSAVGTEPVEGQGWKVIPFRAVHGDQEAYSYRIECGGRSLCYSGDTRLCEALEQAARGVDLLLCECSIPRGYPQHGDHMISDQVGQLASRVAARRVVLTHLYTVPGVDLVSEVKDHYGGPVETAVDGRSYEL